MQASVDSTGATSPHVNISTIKNYQLVVPSSEEQDAIVKQIQNICTPLHNLIDKAKEEIGLLGEYRHTLINDIVTGKIKL